MLVNRSSGVPKALQSLYKVSKPEIKKLPKMVSEKSYTRLSDLYFSNSGLIGI
jgi:hypothetical protein